jgi:MFS family permease
MSRNYGWVIVAAGAFISCVAFGAMFALPVYLQTIAEETGWTRAGISGAMTIGFIVMGIAGFAWGALSDRIGARPIVLIGGVVIGLGLLIASQARDLIVFQLAYGGLMGVAFGAFGAPITATTLSWFDKHRGLAISLGSIGGGIAPMIFSPLATVLIEMYGWRTSMLITAIAAAVLILPVALLIRPAPAGFAGADPEPAPAAGDAAASATPAKSSGWASLRTPQFAVLAGVFFLCCAAHSGPIFHTVSYAMICGASALAAASIYSVEGLAGLFGRLLFGVAADRLGVRRVLVVGLAIQAVAIYSYIYVSELPGFYALAVVLGMAYSGVMPLYFVLARDYFSSRVMGTVVGGMVMVSSIGMAFGPVGGGWLYDTFGTYHWLYIASGAIGLGAAAVALAFPPPRRQNDDGRPAELQPA